MIQNAIFFFFIIKKQLTHQNIISSIQRFYICPDVPVDIIKVFF